MRTRNYILILMAAMAVFAFSSCKGKLSPRAYNETIVQLHSSMGDALNGKMEQIFDFENTSKEQAETLIGELNKSYDYAIERLAGMNYPDSAADWHKSTTELFVYIKENVIPLFSETLKYEPESADWYRVWNEIDARNSKAGDLEDKMIAEQQKFAAAAGQQLR